MPTVNEKGYLERDYLTDEYGAGFAEYGWGFQANQIINKEQTFGMQAQQTIKAEQQYGMQAQQTIQAQELTGMQANQILNIGEFTGMQAQQTINANNVYGMQAQQTIKAEEAYGMQALQTIVAVPPTGMQAQQTLVEQLKTSGMEAFMGNIRHAHHPEYLAGDTDDGYLEGPYLVDRITAEMGMQATMSIKEQSHYGMQAQQTIKKQQAYGMQALQTIKVNDLNGMQANMLKTTNYGMQANNVIYNITQLRVMVEFPSRGIKSMGGNSWTVSPPAEAGDFGVNNLNTDIIEQVYRSQNGDQTLVNLTCDTGVPQGVVVDTMAILGHNLTRGALVQVQTSNDGTFSPPLQTFNLEVSDRNMFYIAPELPKSGFRYWRFIIQDENNPDEYIQIGAIIFGSSRILSLNGSFDNPLIKGRRHFKDVIPTEGFTNVMNSRTVKEYLRLKFTDLDLAKGDFTLLDEVIAYAKTSLKCLWIPTPLNAKRFAIFGKLVDMPEMTHNSIDEDEENPVEYISFDIEVDESL